MKQMAFVKSISVPGDFVAIFKPAICKPLKLGPGMT
jgi:hypothetical protein